MLYMNDNGIREIKFLDSLWHTYDVDNNAMCKMAMRTAYNSALKTLVNSSIWPWMMLLLSTIQPHPNKAGWPKKCCIPNTTRGFRSIHVHCNSIRTRMGSDQERRVKLQQKTELSHSTGRKSRHQSWKPWSNLSDHRIFSHKNTFFFFFFF